MGKVNELDFEFEGDEKAEGNSEDELEGLIEDTFAEKGSTGRDKELYDELTGAKKGGADPRRVS